MSEWLTYQEAASLLGVSARTIRRRVRDGYIRTVRPGGGRRYIPRDELERHRYDPEARPSD